ncbi:hypothetical protein B9Z55_007796 [Caenorhabditis nigoni]|uniref:Uncharacterized protein n=1 Tax=Caenorhabditis nigoni TaxID=1611254 RepID=A0A2G5VBL4_9PELO|nr:hypothetical protein B9Z55_007796 [Caenorhabditis nigoni]
MGKSSKDEDDGRGVNWGAVEELRYEGCKQYISDGKPQNTEAQKNQYKFCCEERGYCAFYLQPWFWLTIGGVLLALIAVSVFLSVYCCCLRKRRGGGGVDSEIQKEAELPEKGAESKSSESEESDCD